MAAVPSVPTVSSMESKQVLSTTSATATTTTSSRMPVIDASTPTMDRFLVIDFEATCEKNRTIVNQEIIEFPAILMDANTGEVIDTFHSYVKPVNNPILTPFCTKLTGITQAMVDSAQPWRIVWKRFLQFLGKNRISPVTCVVFTFGDWDLGTMLPKQAALCRTTRVPEVMKQAMDVKESYQRMFDVKISSLEDLIEKSGLTRVGRWHSGIDDAMNVVNVLKLMIKHGYVVQARTADSADSIANHDSIHSPDSASADIDSAPSFSSSNSGSSTSSSIISSSSSSGANEEKEATTLSDFLSSWPSGSSSSSSSTSFHPWTENDTTYHVAYKLYPVSNWLGHQAYHAYSPVANKKPSH